MWQDRRRCTRLLLGSDGRENLDLSCAVVLRGEHQVKNVPGGRKSWVVDPLIKAKCIEGVKEGPFQRRVCSEGSIWLPVQGRKVEIPKDDHFSPFTGRVNLLEKGRVHMCSVKDQ